jgi:hypothetical protein
MKPVALNNALEYISFTDKMSLPDKSIEIGRTHPVSKRDS